MKKIILGLIIGLSLSAGIVFAKDISIKWYITDTIDSHIGWTYEKTYDENTNVVCYVWRSYDAVGGISCVKNN